MRPALDRLAQAAVRQDHGSHPSQAARMRPPATAAANLWPPRGCSSMAEHQLPKLNTGVRFPSSAPVESPARWHFLTIPSEALRRAGRRRPRADLLDRGNRSLSGALDGGALDGAGFRVDRAAPRGLLRRSHSVRRRLTPVSAGSRSQRFSSPTSMIFATWAMPGPSVSSSRRDWPPFRTATLHGRRIVPSTPWGSLACASTTSATPEARSLHQPARAPKSSCRGWSRFGSRAALIYRHATPGSGQRRSQAVRRSGCCRVLDRSDRSGSSSRGSG